MSANLRVLYDNARRNGLAHEAALDAIRDGEFACWCGRVEYICHGGAQRLIGCPVFIETPMGRWDYSHHQTDIPMGARP